ncbi:MAG: type I phosphomannose isomerase catalytic subunit [Microbacter sp.]
MSSVLYPLKFKPIFQSRIWGGDRLRTLGKQLPDNEHIGESWELSGVPGNESVVMNGFLTDNSLSEIIEVYMDEMVGKKIYDQFGTQFPLLIKFIDAEDDLSIQVHPNDQLAMERHQSYGKTEMWYVIDGSPEASLISGFIPNVDKTMYLNHLQNGTLDAIMQRFQVSKGDVFFIPAGRVHAIGKGCLIAEIQQTSDITYRLFDYNRKDNQGKLRELHTDLALDAIDFQYVSDAKYHPNVVPDLPVEIVSCPYFTTNLIHLQKTLERDYYRLDSFVIFICLNGSFIIETNGNETWVTKGETVLLPALLSDVRLKPQPKAELLEIYVK